MVLGKVLHIRQLLDTWPLWICCLSLLAAVKLQEFGSYGRLQIIKVKHPEPSKTLMFATRKATETFASTVMHKPASTNTTPWVTAAKPETSVQRNYIRSLRRTRSLSPNRARNTCPRPMPHAHKRFTPEVPVEVPPAVGSCI